VQIARKMGVGLSKSRASEGAEAMRRLQPTDSDAELVRERPSSSIKEGERLRCALAHTLQPSQLAVVAAGNRAIALAWGDSLVTLARALPT
jgi:hypothetical protein